MLAVEQEKLFENIEILPIDMKTKLINILLKSINPTDKSLDDLWIAEADKRKKEIESGNVKTIDGNEVFNKIQRRFHS